MLKCLEFALNRDWARTGWLTVGHDVGESAPTLCPDDN